MIDAEKLVDTELALEELGIKQRLASVEQKAAFFKPSGVRTVNSLSADGKGDVSLTTTTIGAVPATRTLTINGSAQDLSADRSWLDTTSVPTFGGLILNETTTGLTAKVTGFNTTVPGTFINDSSDAIHEALIASNNNNFAYSGNVMRSILYNATDTGVNLKLENAGTGNYITADSVWSISKAGLLTIPNITLGSLTGILRATAGVISTTTAYVTSATGTANQVLVNGTSGSAQTGAVTVALAQGASNQLLGMNKTATTNEYKTLLGTTNQISVALGTANQITLATPQDIAAASSPTFAGLTLSGLTLGSVIFAGTGGLISQNNANLFWDNSALKLGVGTSNPTERFVVAGTAAGTANEGSMTMQRFSTSDSARFFWKDGVSTYLWSMGVRSNRTDLSFFDEAAGEFMTIQKTTGNIGIGTTNPNNRLSIVARAAGDEPSVLMKRFQLADYARFFFQSGSTFLWSMGLRGSVNDYHFTDETTGFTLLRLIGGSPDNAIVVNTNGVGIGTASPSTTLHVNGGVTHKRTAVNDAAYQILATDYFVAYTAITAARNVTPPTGVTGQTFIIKDEAGAAATFNLNFVGTLDGAVNPTLINTNYGVKRIYYSGSAWFSF